MRFHILATGPSMSQELADSLRSENCVVVNNAFELAPWAMALCAQDHSWWRVHPHAHKFAGRKFTANRITDVERVTSDYVGRDSSSGVLSLEVARLLGATEIHLHGFDNHGAHYFGKHKAPLNQTTPGRYEVFQQQFAAIGKFLAKEGITVVNKTPGSALRAFPIVLN